MAGLGSTTVQRPSSWWMASLKSPTMNGSSRGPSGVARAAGRRSRPAGRRDRAPGRYRPRGRPGTPGPPARRARRPALPSRRQILDEGAFLGANEEARAGVDVHLDPRRIDAEIAGEGGLELGAAAVVDQTPDRAGVAPEQQGAPIARLDGGAALHGAGDLAQPVDLGRRRRQVEDHGDGDQLGRHQGHDDQAQGLDEQRGAARALHPHAFAHGVRVTLEVNM
jgi:hypothetical protein